MKMISRRFIVFLTTATFVSVLPQVSLANVLDARMSTSHKVGILIDLTVKDRKAALTYLEALEKNLIVSLESEGNRKKNVLVSLTEIDSRGENAPVFTVEIPAKPGFKRRILKHALVELSEKFEDYSHQYLFMKPEWKSSRYMESVRAAITNYDEIYIIGDMAVVDPASGRNFEIGKFGTQASFLPKAKGKAITYIRVPFPGMSDHRIRMIEKWWDMALYGAKKRTG